MLEGRIGENWETVRGGGGVVKFSSPRYMPGSGGAVPCMPHRPGRAH